MQKGNSLKKLIMLDFYYSLSCVSCRAVIIALQFFKIPFQDLELNTTADEHLSKKIFELNPLLTLPIIKDGDVIICDSHAINAYLVHKYGKNDSYYPVNPAKRAIIDQMLFYESGVMQPAIQWLIDEVRAGTLGANISELVKSYENIYQYIVKIRKRTGFDINKYDAGWITGFDDITIADFSFCTSLGLMHQFVPIHPRRFSFADTYRYRCMFDMNHFRHYNEKGNELLLHEFRNKHGLYYPAAPELN